MKSELLHAKWEDYLFVTLEMNKFLAVYDLKMFFSLVEQRETLQSELEILSNKVYNESAKGKELLEKIQQANQEMLNQFHFVFNTMKNRESVSQAYGTRENMAGNFINNRT